MALPTRMTVTVRSPMRFTSEHLQIPCHPCAIDKVNKSRDIRRADGDSGPAATNELSFMAESLAAT
jgi:hypothetical protein